MGGWGSGSRYDSRSTTEDYRRLSIQRLARGGWLRDGVSCTQRWTQNGLEQGTIGMRAENHRLVLTYRIQCGGPWESLEYPITLDSTRCHYGGERRWFLCPNKGCGRRVGTLYCNRYFVCRHCLRLVYESQRESPAYRQLSKAQAIRVKLGGTGSMIDLFPAKPKGMHWRNYTNLKYRHDIAYYDSNIAMARQLGIDLNLP